MTCQALICVVDQRTPRRKGDPYRPKKHRPGEIICVRDTPTQWGRMEGPLGQSMKLEINATAAYIHEYIKEYTDQPILSRTVHNNHIRCTVTFPPTILLEEHEYEFLHTRFRKWVKMVSPYGMVVDLHTPEEIFAFPKVFAREYRDKILKTDGPRFVVNERFCQKVAWEGGFSRCDVRIFENNLIDRGEKRFDLRLAA